MGADSDGSHLAGGEEPHRTEGAARPPEDVAHPAGGHAPHTGAEEAPRADGAAPARNIIDGQVTLSGMTVQAGAVHGGIHAHLPPAPRPIPRQLPPVSRHFTDRESDIRALNELHARRGASAPPLIVVTGPAGVGKTTLVTRWLSGLTEEYPDGHFYADLRGHAAHGAASPGEVLGQFLRAVGAPPAAGLAEQMALWRSATAQLRIAVLLDNAFTAAQVRPLLPSGADSLVAVTCRRRLTGLRTDGADVHELGSLPPVAATELLRRGLGSERIERDSAAAARVVALCAGLPLALCLVSARLAARPEQPVGTMAEALSSEQERLTVLNVEGERAVRGVLDESYAGLSEPVAQLYRALGMLPVLAFDTRLAAAVCQVPPAEAETRLEALAEANLLEDHGAAGYRFHDLVRLHAAERARAAADDDTREATVRRAFDVRLAAVAEAERLLVPARRPLAREHAAPPGLVARFESPPAALTWLDAQRLDLMRLLREAAARKWHHAVWQLADSMWPLFLRLRHYDDWIEAHRLGLTAARQACDATAERQMLTSGAAGLSSLGRLPEAIEWYRMALASARAEGAERPYGQALLGIGACMYESGRGSEGVPVLREAIEVWERIGYLRGAALARIVLGEIALEAGDPTAAVEHFAHAHRTLGTVDDPHDEARALAFLGFAHGRAGDMGAGTRELARALEEFTRAGSAHWRGRALEMLGLLAETQHDAGAARAWYEQGLAAWSGVSSHDAARLRDRLRRLPGPAGQDESEAPHRPRGPGDADGPARSGGTAES
ncbi:tetratricopeptide repeat protein [Streptomyces axinellae]